jgi:hypothetical protein
MTLVPPIGLSVANLIKARNPSRRNVGACAGSTNEGRLRER